jgi:glycosyltransferase involved in cell wall biosynthesis
MDGVITMRIGVFAPPSIPTSFVVYLSRVSSLLSAQGVDCVRFGSAIDLPPGCDLLWDIRSGGGNPPPDALMVDGLPPLVVTIHGFAPLSLPILEYYRSWRERIDAVGHAARQRRRWASVQQRIAGVIAVSRFTQTECLTHAGIAAQRVHVCHHGVDAETFGQPALPGDREGATFLHVSNDEPRKNLPRVISAFAKLRRRHPGARLRLKLPTGAGSRYVGLPGVEVLTGHLPTHELAAMYAQATAFVFPSLYEGFGLPILEAMSAGCPVITSTASACPEVAGDAALCVDPRSVPDIEAAMSRLLDEAGLQRRLHLAGLVQAAGFTWEACAAGHRQAFDEVLSKR